MKKLLSTIIIGATMVCCQSEDNTVQELQESQEQTEEVKVNCLSALVSDGELVQVFDYWQNIPGMHQTITVLNYTDQHHRYCFDISKYTTEEMIKLVKAKYE